MLDAHPVVVTQPDPVECLNLLMEGASGVSRWRRYFQPVPELSRDMPLPLLGIMVLIWQLRADDLQSRFPLDSVESRLDFIAWCVVHGSREYAALAQAELLWQALAHPAPMPGAPLRPDDAGHAISWKMLLIARARTDLAFDAATPAGRATLLAWMLAHVAAEMGTWLAALAPWQVIYLRERVINDNVVMSRFEHLLYWQRADLRAAFPLPAAAAGYLDWFADMLARQPAFAAFLPAVQAPCAASPTIEASPGPLLSGVNVIGYAYGQLGIGEDARMAVRALDAAGLPVTLLDFALGPHMPQNDRSMAGHVGVHAVYDTNLFCLTALEHGRFAAERGFELLEGRRNIGYWPWELALWPRPWRHLFSLVDEVWSASEHTLEAARAASLVPVRLIPPAVELPQIGAQGRTEFGLPLRACLFLFSFDLNSSARRKNPQACVAAFQQAFPRAAVHCADASQVGLVIKVHPPTAPDAEWDSLKALQADDPRIHLIERTLDKDDLLALYRACDCFISLHRAEGFGRGIAEAMLLGKPVIVTGYSGNMAFTNEDNALLVRYVMAPLRSGDYPFGAGQEWAEPDVSHAARQMRRVLARAKEVARMAERGRADVARRHLPRAAGAAYATVLADAVVTPNASPAPLRGDRPALIVCDAAATAIAGHFLSYTLCVAGAARKMGCEVRVLCNRVLGATPRLLGDLLYDIAYQGPWGGVDSRALPRFGPGHPVADTLAALDRIVARRGDRVLVHTLSLLEMQAWLDWLTDQTEQQLQALPSWHFVLRFDPAPLERRRNPAWAALRRKLCARQDELAARVQLFADTVPLQRRYAALLGVPVALAPIPLDLRQLLSALRQPGGRRHSRRTIVGPVVALYLGDARPEKGIEALPALARGLWDSHLRSGRLRLVIQANFNVPGGQSGTAAALRELARYPADIVELIHEAMPADEYYRRLAQADLVLLPYDAAAYSARSSGICVEALAAGKPFVTTAGSWMASQAGAQQMALIRGAEDLPTAVAELLERLPMAAAAARRAAPLWRRASNPAHFVRQLAEAGTAPSRSVNTASPLNSRPTLSQIPGRASRTSPAGYGSLAGLIGACGARQRQWQWPPVRPHDIPRGQARAIAFDGALDVLYLADNTPQHVAALRDFLATVYFPILAPQGVTLAVVGAVCDAAAWPECDTLLLVGILDDPAPLLSAALACVTPASRLDKPAMLRDASNARRRRDAAPGPAPAVAWSPAWLLANRLLLAWLGDDWHAAVPATGMAATALSQHALRAWLMLALPAVLKSPACDAMPAAARRGLLAEPGRAIDMLLALMTAGNGAFAQDGGIVRATVVAHGALRAQLLVQLSRTDQAPQGVAQQLPPLSVTCGGRSLPMAARVADGTLRISCSFPLPLAPEFPYFQPLDLVLTLAPGDWRIEGAMLHQQADTMLFEHAALPQFQPQLHAFTSDRAGGGHAWTAQPSLSLALPCWRGGDTLVIVQTCGLGRNAPDDVSLRAGAMPLPLACDADDLGVILSASLPARPAWPFEPLWQLDAPIVRQASAHDSRLVGMALRGIALVSQLGPFS